MNSKGRKNRGISPVILILIVAIIAVSVLSVVPVAMKIPSSRCFSTNKSHARQARSLASDRYHEDLADGNITFTENEDGDLVTDHYYWYDSTQQKLIGLFSEAGDGTLPSDINFWEIDTLDETVDDTHYTLGSQVYRYWVIAFKNDGSPILMYSYAKGDRETQDGF